MPFFLILCLRSRDNLELGPLVAFLPCGQAESAVTPTVIVALSLIVMVLLYGAIIDIIDIILYYVVEIYPSTAVFCMYDNDMHVYSVWQDCTLYRCLVIIID